MSSAQIIGGVGTLFLLLLGLIGWLVAAKLGTIDKDLQLVKTGMTSVLADMKVHAGFLADLKEWRNRREDAHQKASDEQARVLREELNRLRGKA